MGQQEAYEKQLLSLEGVIQTLREEQNVDVLIQATLNYLQAQFKYRLIWIGLYDAEKNQLLGKGGVTPTADPRFLKAKFALNSGDLLEQVLRERKSMAIADLRSEARAAELHKIAQNHGIQGTLLFPLWYKDRSCGLVLLGSHLWGTTPRTGEKAQLSLLFGSLGTALSSLDLRSAEPSIKRPDEQMFEMLNELQNLPTLENRLEVVVNKTHDFITPARTNLYWYSPERRFFWQRIANRKKGRSRPNSNGNAPTLTVLDVSDFYLALAADQVIAIGEGKSPLKVDVSNRVLSHLRSQSILAAPILVKKELLGFLALEEDSPRSWEESEEKYIRAAACTLALLVGTYRVEESVQETQQDTHLIAEIASAIATETDPQAALRACCNLLLQRLGANYFFVVQESNQQQRPKNAYKIVYQNQPQERRSTIPFLNPLNVTEREQLLASETVIAIDDWEKDQKFKEWRDVLMPFGVRSLLVCRGGNSQNSSFLLIGHNNPRTWNQPELGVVGAVSQKLSIVLHPSTTQTITDRSSLALQTLQAGLTVLLSAPSDPIWFERAWLQYLAQSLECPLVALLTVQAQNQEVKVATVVTTNPSFSLPQNGTFPLSNDPLLREAIASESFLACNIANLPNETRQWLNLSSTGQVLVKALHSTTLPDDLSKGRSSSASQSYLPLGFIVIVDSNNRSWSPHVQQPLDVLMRQFTGLRHYRRMSATHSRELRDMEQLNWYKHRCLETLYQSVGSSIKGLLELDAKEQNQYSTEQEIRRVRTAQILHSLENVLAPLTPLVNQEQWQLQTRLIPLSLENTLKRSLRRLEPLYNQRQILIRIHNTGNLNIYADPLKLECVLFELLVMFCYRTQPKNRVDLWSRLLSEEGGSLEGSKQTPQPNNLQPLMELVITENELIQPLTESEDNESEEEQNQGLYGRFVTSTSQQPPNFNLTICQRVLRSWGGDLQFYQLENGHFLTRLMLKCQE